MTAARSVRSASPQYVTLADIGATAWVRNFNPFVAGDAEQNQGGIYEPLYILTTAGGGHSYPWLATAYTWTDGNKTLLITVRKGVKWSDGVPFTPDDVVFTLTYGKTAPFADQNGLWSGGHLQSVNRVGADQVAVHFKTLDTTVLPFVLSTIKILPKHIWSTIKNPATFTNLNPVGTGPFTQIIEFTPQEYILGKNPYYWQPGEPKVDGLRVPLYTSSDSNYLALDSGELDWTQDFVPSVEQTYVRRDPAHYHYFFATNTQPVALVFNNEKYPYSLVAFRMAISHAVDRKKIWQIGEYGYEPPSDAAGVSAAWPSWMDQSLVAQAKAEATYDPQLAKSILTKAGFTYKGGLLYDPKGNKVTIELGVAHDWPDFVTNDQIMQREFSAIGIQTTIKTFTDSDWFDKSSRGLLVADLNFPNGGLTPYYYFYDYMSKESYVPTGTPANTNGLANYERWYSLDATNLLAQWRHTTDVTTQKALASKLEKIQLDNMPIIPLMYSAAWYTYSTKHFVGWPTPDNYYAIGGPGWAYPDYLKVMVSIRPVS
jgi:peptide/nickel transport system substrate-binding protein